MPLYLQKCGLSQIILFYVTMALGQGVVDTQYTVEYSEITYNLYDVISATDADNPHDMSEGSHHRQLKKMNMMWGNKMFPSGLSHHLGRGITAYVKNFIDDGYSYCHPLEWVELGPIGKPEKAFSSGGSGQIHAIRCSPNYLIDKTVYAASNWGGLWRKVGDMPWQMLNTDTQLPFTSVSDIAIDYQTPNILYITTGDAEMSIGHHAQNHDGGPSKMTPLFTAGVWRSHDGGLNWHAINGGPRQPLLDDFAQGGTIRKVIIHPQNPNILYINSSEGVYKTTNARSAVPTWSRIFYPQKDRELKGLEFKPYKPSTLYISGIDIYISTNDGRKWQSMTGPNTGLDLKTLPDDFLVDRINIAVTDANSEILYAYITGSCLEKQKRIPRLYIFKYDGKKWNEILVQTDRGSNKFITPTRTPIVCSPTQEDHVCFGREILWGGKNIKDKAIRLTGYNSGNIHADIHALAFIPGENKVWIGSDGGVHIKDLSFQNTSGGEDISEGLAVKTIYRFDDSADADDKIMIGSQDTGTDVYRNGIWTFIDGGDGYNGKIDMKTGIAYYSMNFSLMAYNWRRKFSSEHKLPKDPTTGQRAWIRGTFDMKNHPQSEKLIFSMTELYERTHHAPAQNDENPDSLWSVRSDIGKFISEQWRRQLSEFDVSLSHPDYWMIALSGTQVQENQSNTKLIVEPKLFRAINGPCLDEVDFKNRSCFEDITQNLIDSGAVLSDYGYTEIDGRQMTPIITSVLFHPENHLRVWVTFTGYQDQVKVWQSNDGGDNWFNTDPQGSLHNLPVNDIVYQKGTDDRLYIATDAGIYTKDNTETEWQKFCNFPNAIVTKLKINYCNQKLRASTFGRGMWEANLLPGSGTLGTTEFIIDEDSEWTLSRGIDRHIRIKSGNTLKLKGDINSTMTLSMPALSQIIIESDAYLILDNAHITNNCGKAWEGISISGDESSASIQLFNSSSISATQNGISIIQANKEVINTQYLWRSLLGF